MLFLVDGRRDQLIEAMKSGTPLNFATSGYKNPCETDGWTAERTVSAEALREVLLMQGLCSDPHGLELVGARITGELNLEYAALPCRLTLRQCRITQPVLMERVSVSALDFSGSFLVGLDLDGACISGDVRMNDNLQARGLIRAIGAQIGGQLAFKGAELVNVGAVALNLDSACIGGNVNFSSGFNAVGEVRALGARIAGQVTLRGAQITNEGGDALSLDGAHVGGEVLADRSFTATGCVRMLKAQIDRHLVLSEATLNNEGGAALRLDGAHIRGDVLLDARFVGVGEVSAVGAQVDGKLSLRGAIITNKDQIALNLERARIGGATWFDEKFSATGTVRLNFAQLGVVAVDPQYWRWGSVIATGWSVRDTEGALSQPRIARDWLDTVPDGHFAAQPWHELAAVYERNGDLAKGRRLRSWAAYRTTRSSPRYARPVRLLYGLFAGYGYYPLLAAVWLGLGAVAAWLIIWLTGTADMVDAWVYAVHVVLPPAAAIASEPLASIKPCILLTMMALKAFGWLQTAVLLAGFTGLLRKV